jgi:alpha-tubulin suppressor-like RCC1 family protein
MGDRAVPRTEHGRSGHAHASGPAIRAALAVAVAASALTLTALALSLAAITSSAAASNGASAWGQNSSGQLGNGTTTNSDVPIEVEGLSGITAVAAGAEHSLALLNDGKVMAWGGNAYGQLGNGTTTNSDVPIVVKEAAGKELTGVTAIAAGAWSSYALLSNGTVLSWGNNESGQLGNATTTNSDEAVPVKESTGKNAKSLSGVSAIAAGGEHTLALLRDGKLMSWGANEYGELGDGKTAKSDLPVTVSDLPPTGASVMAISAGREHSLALLSNHTVMAWGDNEDGQLGIGYKEVKKEGETEYVEIEKSNVPIPVENLNEATAISAGDVSSLALLSNGTVMAWGSNLDGELGDGAFGAAAETPQAVQELTGVSAISAGGHHNLALLDDGTVMAWGFNLSGQLGDGSTTKTGLPGAVNGLASVDGIAAGESHSLAFGAPFPTVTGVTPDAGPTAGDTEVEITGANYLGATVVDFGSIPALEFHINSDSSITAYSPPADAGMVHVAVVAPSGTSTDVPASDFTYVAAPEITKVSPTKGPAAGGTSVTITATGLTDVTSVAFGSGPAEFHTNSSTSITAISPPGTAGTADIRVKTAYGESATVPQDHFKYEAPTITGISPGSGALGGGANVVITGTGFGVGPNTTTFKFGKMAASTSDCASSTECEVLAPAAEKAGTVEVFATVDKLKSKKNPPADRFTYE